MINWTAYVQKTTDDDCKKLADDRGYRVEFCHWLRAKMLFATVGGQFAIPVFGPDGTVISYQHKDSDGKLKFLPGKPTSPLVIGALTTAKLVLAFESVWDAFAYMAVMNWDTNESAWTGFAVIVTRGSGNGKRVRNLIPVTARVIVVMQNDPLEEDGSPGAADRWLVDVVEAVNRRIYVMRPPAEHKDLNDWTRAGATRGDIMLAVRDAFQNGVGEARKTEATAPPPNASPAPADARREFPTDALGATLAKFVREVARVQRVPESLVACIVLGVLSATLGKQLRGRLLPGMVTPPNLYIIAAVRSGVGKSVAAQLCDGPLHSYSMGLAEAWKRKELPALQAAKGYLIEQRRKLTRSAKVVMPEADECGLLKQLAELELKLVEIDEKLIEPRLITEDVTTQKLAMLLHANQEQLCVLSRDAGDVVNNILGRNHKLDCPDESIFLKCYSLDTTAVDRVGRPSIQLHEPCLTVLLLTQPDELDRLLQNRSLRDGGLMPRFLIHRTEAQPQHMDVSTPSFDPALRMDYAQLVESLIRSFRCSTGDPTIVDATPEAKQAFVDYHNAGVDRRLVGDESMDSFAARHTEQACRLTLVLHAADHGPDAGQHPVDLDCASRGIEIAEWFAAEQLALLTGSRSRSAADLKAAIMALAQKEKYEGSGIGTRDVQRAKIVEQAVQAMDLLEELVTEGRLELMPPSPTGKGGPRYRLPTK